MVAARMMDSSLNTFAEVSPDQRFHYTKVS